MSIYEIINKKIKEITNIEDNHNGGQVLQFSDNIASIYGLNESFLGEKVKFLNSGHIGMIISLGENEVKAIVFGLNYKANAIKEGDIVESTGEPLQVTMGSAMLGYIVDALGNPLDGSSLSLKKKINIFATAPGIIKRREVSSPLYTGIKTIDALIPIGKGQRELIIGDRQTGKTTIAIDMILSQKHGYDNGNPVYCIYVAIGQKGSDIASIVNLLKERDAMKYTIIVCATAADGYSEKYIAPYTGCAIAEYFRDRGDDALIIYDDLSKHADAYRSISLFLRRSPGREAYPGDMFYAHSSLLERAANLEKGSLTAIPIIETQAGDISGYISTNVISITDGQIFLNSSYFHRNIKPAIDIGMSVSRVGGAAQFPLVRKLCGKFKLYISQAKELEAFSKMSTDLDKDTQTKIENGRKIEMMLQQKQYTPVSINESLVIFYLLDKYINHIENISQVNSIIAHVKQNSIWSKLDGQILSKDEEKILQECIQSCLRS